jgi:RimJ/RimL family protein N-acetyltransferase
VADTTTERQTYIDSARLRLVAANAALVRADLSGRGALEAALGVTVPDNWPPTLYDRVPMETALRQLEETGQVGWSFWYLVLGHGDDGVLCGICGFKGAPDVDGAVEMGYSVLGQHRNTGIATEAVARLLRWAFSHRRVLRVAAETLPHLRQSIRVMEKNGFHFVGEGSERGVVRYEVHRSELR